MVGAGADSHAGGEDVGVVRLPVDSRAGIGGVPIGPYCYCATAWLLSVGAGLLLVGRLLTGGLWSMAALMVKVKWRWLSLARSGHVKLTSKFCQLLGISCLDDRDYDWSIQVFANALSPYFINPHI